MDNFLVRNANVCIIKVARVLRLIQIINRKYHANFVHYAQYLLLLYIREIVFGVFKLLN